MFENLLSYFEEDIDIVECEFISVEEDDALFVDEESVQAKVFFFRRSNERTYC